MWQIKLSYKYSILNVKALHNSGGVVTSILLVDILATRIKN